MSPVSATAVLLQLSSPDYMNKQFKAAPLATFGKKLPSVQDITVAVLIINTKSQSVTHENHQQK